MVGGAVRWPLVEHILGQRLAVESLQNALRTGRLHHAYIFHGPKGVGKFTTARAFAAALLCPNPLLNPLGPVRACGSCPVCKLTQDGTHPDEHVIKKELASYSYEAKARQRKLITIPISVLREQLINPVYLAPRLGRHKVFIIDEAELIADEVQNLLLKTLEEPPPHTFVILVTDSPDRLLPTILSRCQRVPFVPLPQQVIAERLGRGEQLEPAARHWLTDFAAGSLGQVELSLAYGLYEWARVVLPAIDAMAQSRYPSELGQQMAAFIDSFAKQWVHDHHGASKDAANKHATALLWSIIAQHAQSKIHALANQCDPNDPESAESTLTPWLGVIDALNDAQRHIARNVHLGLVTDHLVSLLYRALADTT